MKPVAWIGSNFDEAYLTWDKPRPDEDPNPVAVYHEADVAPLVEAVRAYESECANPVMDPVLKRKRREAMFAALTTIDAQERGV